MSVWVTLDRAQTGDGGEMTLALLDDRYVIRVDGQDLMNSHSHGSEEKLARYGCAGLAAKPGARVLIGGMGMGFTVRAALDVLAADAMVDVVELVGAVVRWNRDVLGHLARVAARRRAHHRHRGRRRRRDRSARAPATTRSCSTSTTAPSR